MTANKADQPGDDGSGFSIGEAKTNPKARDGSTYLKPANAPVNKTSGNTSNKAK